MHDIWKGQNMLKAIRGWCDADNYEPPEWVKELAIACDAETQEEVARKLEFSAGVVSAVLSNTYNGSMDAVEYAVRGALMGETVPCNLSIYGKLNKRICLHNQRRPRHKLDDWFVKRSHDICEACPNNLANAKKAEAQPVEVRNTRHSDRAKAAWGKAMPRWVGDLAEACDREGAETVAQKIGYSRTSLSLLLGKTYDGNPTKVRTAFLAAYPTAAQEVPS